MDSKQIRRMYIMIVCFSLCYTFLTFGQHDHGSKHDHKGHDHTTLFYTGAAAFDIQQSFEEGLEREIGVSTAEAGIGFSIDDLVEAFFMISMEEGFNVSLHEAEISYLPNDFFWTTVGLFHMPFGSGYTRLKTDPLLTECSVEEKHEEHPKEEEEHHEITFHSIETHAPGVIVGVNNNKVGISGSYYVQSESGGDGHDHGGLGSHQGFTLRPTLNVKDIFKLGIGSRFRIGRVSIFDTTSTDTVEERVSKLDADVDVRFIFKPRAKIALISEVYYSLMTNIAPDNGKFLGYYGEFDFLPTEKLLFALRFDHFINSERVEEEEEKNEEEEEHEKIEVMHIGFGSTFSITENLKISAEFNVRKEFEELKKQFLLQISFHFDK